MSLQPFTVIGITLGMFAGTFFAFALIDHARERKRGRNFQLLVGAVLIFLALTTATVPAKAAVVAEVPGVVRFTDETSPACPRLHYVALAPDNTRGCWTIGEWSRVIVVTWPNGTRIEYTEMQFEIYAR